MARRRSVSDGASPFGGGGLFPEDAEDADPRVGLVNLADVMLVFAAGLMLALVTAWNLDMSSLSEMVQTDNTVEIESPETLTDESSGSSFVDRGHVYEDPDTGKLYIEDTSGS